MAVDTWGVKRSPYCDAENPKPVPESRIWDAAGKLTNAIPWARPEARAVGSSVRGVGPGCPGSINRWWVLPRGPGCCGALFLHAGSMR